MGYSEDFYFFSGSSIRNACRDHSVHNIQMNSPARALFFSLLLRKKFDKNICFATDTVLENISNDKEHGETFKNFILNESICEEKVNDIYDGLSMMGKEVASTLSIATVKAGDCQGQVKVVFPNEDVDKISRILNALELPLKAINEKQAEEEISAVHNSLVQGSR